jgi:hypothetical protein
MTALAVIAAAALAGAAQAQPGAAPAAPAASVPTPDTGAGAAFTDDQVKHFAAALMSVKKVSDTYQPKIAAASGDAATTLRNGPGRVRRRLRRHRRGRAEGSGPEDPHRPADGRPPGHARDQRPVSDEERHGRDKPGHDGFEAGRSRACGAS